MKSVKKLFDKKNWKISKDRFTKKRLKVFAKTFSIAVIILFAFLAFCWYLSEYLDHRATDEISFPTGMDMGNYDEYMETQKETPSDIEGMSVYDKFKMGLQVQDGSDSDYDGLTDKDEIEKYGTDPFAASTAGDLYSDGYKVEKGLDLFTYQEYEGEKVFPYVECPEVLIEAKSPTDFNTVVQDYTDTYSLEEYGIKTVYKGYALYNYDGIISIDLKDVVSENNVDINKMKIYIADDLFLVPGVTELEQCEYTIDGDVATLNFDFNSDKQYLVYLAGEKQLSFNAMLDDIIDSFYVGNKNNDIEYEEKGIIYGSPILDQFFGNGLKAYYSDSSSESNTHQISNKFIQYCDSYIAGSISNANIYDSTEIQVLTKQKLFDTFFSYFESPIDNRDTSRIRNAFFIYTKYNDNNKNEVSISSDNAKPNFNKDIDELPFQNFESYIAKGGNCAGISHLTAYLYNTKTLPENGKYDCEVDGKIQKISWNLRDDKENETLRNPGLSDYKTKKFIDNLSRKNSNYIQNGLSEGEKEFVNMIGCFWAEGNDKIDNSYMLPSGTLENYSVLENMIKYLDQGKILDVYLYMSYGGGHAVNIYGYEHTQYKDQTVFFIYDSNIPGDNRKGFQVDMTNGTCMLQTIRIRDKGGNDKFVYLYYPMSSNKSYLATNRAGQQQYHMLVAMDENWNVLQ